MASYDGGTPGLEATRPAPGKKVDPASPDVEAYSDHLHGKQRAALAKVSKGKPQQQYVYAFNGFAAELTSAEAAELAGQPDVVAVTPTSSSSPRPP